MKYSIKYSIEDFGVIVALPSDKVRLCDRSIIPVIEAGEELDDSIFAQHRLEALEYSPRSFHLKQPLIVWVELTRRCNCSCLHCYIRGGEPREKELTTQQILQLLDDLNDKNVFHVILTGGEPLLHKDFIRIVKYACQLDFSVSFLTNGVLLSEEVIEQLPKDNLVVGVSLDGFHTLSKLRGGEADAQKVKHNLLSLKKARLPMGVMSIMTKLNLYEFAPIFEWCKENNIPIVPSFPAVFTGRMLENSWLMPTLEDVEQHVKIASVSKAQKIALEAESHTQGISFLSLIRCLWYLQFLTKACKGGRGMCYITSEGDVYPCTNCASVEFYNQGNILESSFSEIWDNEFRDFRAITWSDFKHCKDCEVEQEGWLCAGRCPPISYNLHGDQFVCGLTEFQRESVRQRGKMYLEEYGNPSHYWPKR